MAKKVGNLLFNPFIGYIAIITGFVIQLLFVLEKVNTDKTNLYQWICLIIFGYLAIFGYIMGKRG